MSSFLTYYQDLMKHADPRVQSWKMLGGPGPTICLVIAYLFTVKWFLPAYMKNRKPYDLTKVIRYYNILQIASCCLLIYMISTAGWIQGEYTIVCQPIDYSYSPNALRILNAFYLIHLLKIVELIETVFFVLRKKFNQASGLHIYHHASTVCFTYIACEFVGGGMFAIPLMMNLLIHVFMYTYYYLASLGKHWQKTLAPWKRKLTVAQMIQLLLMIVHSATAFQPGCNVPKTILFLYVPNIILLVQMFYSFYTRNYTTKTSENQAK